MIKHSIITLIKEYLERYKEDVHAIKTLDFVSTNDLFWQRENVEGHITASAWVVDKSCIKTLLIHHPKLLQWFQPGGHIEALDSTLFDAALREATEETGLHDLEIVETQIFDIDVHLIPSHKGVISHYHYDIRILLKAVGEEPQSKIIDKIQDCQWVSLDNVSEYNDSKSVMRMVGKTLKV